MLVCSAPLRMIPPVTPALCLLSTFRISCNPIAVPYSVFRVSALDFLCRVLIEHLSITDSVNHLRELIAGIILSNTDQYNEAVLGKVPEEYCEWICEPRSWGGAIELAIFAEHFQTEIVAVDIQTLKLHRFGSQFGFPQKCIVMYDGIHYDAFVMTPFEGAPTELQLTLFPSTDSASEAQALALATKKNKVSTRFNLFPLFSPISTPVCRSTSIRMSAISSSSV
eukprot:m.197052 g.197052  ORF g.197052 m.197052 type:complete len:224 (+) comp53755_c0_seq7:124-795(+)